MKRYEQQIKLPEIGVNGQKQLQKARVLCVGAGGIGATLLPYLAGAGVGVIGIVDDDMIDESNLHRQILYKEEQIGQSKAINAQKQLQALNSKIDVQTYTMRLTPDNAQQLIAQYDLIADCSDNFFTRYLIHDTCFRMKKPYVYASAYQFQGHCSLFYGKENPCLHCLFPAIPNTTTNCQDGGVLGTLPGLLGIIQATEIIKWIAGTGVSLLNRLLCINFLTMEMKNLHLVKNNECQFCVYDQSIRESDHGLCTNDMQSFAVLSQELGAFLAKNPDVLLLDVRTADEHVINNLGGRHIPLADLVNRLHELDPQCSILVYCHSGQRSLQARRILNQAGFRTVYHLNKGMVDFL